MFAIIPDCDIELLLLLKILNNIFEIEPYFTESPHLLGVYRLF